MGDLKKRRRYSSEPNYKFRAFLLRLLDGRELTINEIINSMARDEPETDMTRRNLELMLTRLHKNQLVLKRKPKEKREDRAQLIFTTTNKGRGRIEYYDYKINELNL